MLILIFSQLSYNVKWVFAIGKWTNDIKLNYYHLYEYLNKCHISSVRYEINFKTYLYWKLFIITFVFYLFKILKIYFRSNTFWVQLNV